ncbi:MAG: DUF2158 domain-containing protein [Terriglobales bacterium]
MAQYNAGDVVQLKSGGPKMTVERYTTGTGNQPMVFCIWFAGTEKKGASFSEDALQPA